MATLTAIRTAVVTALEGAFGFDFVAGRYDGPSEDRDIGCVWIEGKREADPVTDEEIFIGVRVFKQWAAPSGASDLPAAQSLEEFCDLVQDTIGPLTGSMGMWMARVAELEILWEQSGVEVTIVGRQLNRGGY